MLNRARAYNPTDPSIWITAAKLEEAQGNAANVDQIIKARHPTSRPAARLVAIDVPAGVAGRPPFARCPRTMSSSTATAGWPRFALSATSGLATRCTRRPRIQRRLAPSSLARPWYTRAPTHNTCLLDCFAVGRQLPVCLGAQHRRRRCRGSGSSRHLVCWLAGGRCVDDRPSG